MFDLAFATNQELIEELMKRNSFVGILIYKRDTNRQCKEKNKGLNGNYKFSHTPNLTTRECLEITKKAADVLNKRCFF